MSLVQNMAKSEKKNNLRTSVATIISDYKNGAYEAQTESGNRFVAYDEAGVKPNVGQKVFYDQDRLRLVEIAPNITFESIPV